MPRLLRVVSLVPTDEGARNMFGISTDGTYTLNSEGVVETVPMDRGYVVARGPLTHETEVRPTDYFGRWEDTADGRIYWDLVEIHYSLQEALTAARSRSEKAIWDAANSQEIRVDTTA
jgi:hypothetical protein